MNTNDFWYNQTHQLSFTVGSTTYSTWNTWHLIPTNKPVIESPDDNLSQVEMKYSNNVASIINSMATTGNLKGSCDFIITSNSPDSVYSSIKTAIHCKYGTITFVDSSASYVGLFKVTGYSPKEQYSTITIEYTCIGSTDSIPALGITKTTGSTTATINTWNDWYLIPTTYPVPEMADDISQSVTIHYIDGTEKEVRISDPHKGVRTGSIEFIIISASPETTYNTIRSWLEGAKKFTVVFPSSGGTHYGTVKLSKFSDSDKFGVIGFDYELYDDDIDDKDSLTASEAHNISITIGNATYNTWTNWKLISEEPIVLDPPEVKTKYVSVPGANGSIDLTEALAGVPKYDNVTGSITFTATATDPLSTYRTIINAIHGKAGSISTEGSMSANGRFSVDGWSSSDGIFKITIGYNIQPYIGS